MGFTVKDSGGQDWDPVPRGVYHAVCYAMIDLGTQYNEMYGNEQHKCWVSWELPEERMEYEGENRPRVISKFYTVSLHEKSNLRNDLESWRGKAFTVDELLGFDISKLLGANCQINVIHKTNKKGQTRAQVGSIMPLSRNMQKKQPENEKLYFSWEDHGHDLPENLPDGIKSMIMKCREWNEQGQMNDYLPDPDQPPIDSYDDDIPF